MSHPIVQEPTPHVLVVDDEPSLRIGFRLSLTTRGYKVATANDGLEALKEIEKEPDLMVLDLRMPGMGGLEVLRELKDRKIVLPTIVASAQVSEPNAFRAIRWGCIDFLPKPVFPDSLRLLVKQVIQEEKLFKENKTESLGPVSHARCLIRRRNFDLAHSIIKEADQNDPIIQQWGRTIESVSERDEESFRFQDFEESNTRFYLIEA